jgi:hypothetical protein
VPKQRRHAIAVHPLPDWAGFRASTPVGDEASPDGVPARLWWRQTQGDGTPVGLLLTLTLGTPAATVTGVRHGGANTLVSM